MVRVRAITFGHHGRPEYIQGPYDNAGHVRDTLRGGAADRPASPPVSPSVPAPVDLVAV